MLKMFQATPDAANSPEFWEQTWSAGAMWSVLENPSTCENDPLYPLFARTLVRDRLFLEGGCGQSQWVKYFADRGQSAVGVDFAVQTIEAIKRRHPALDLRVGNILALPFGDGEVHTYYSGGVVEHFESGPMPALREARRVIADDGWFLCSVPDQSLLRSWLFRGEDVDRPDLDPHLRVRHVTAPEEETPPPRMRFFQYAFTEDEFRGCLADAGFDVAETFGCGITWGLFEVPHVARLYGALLGAARRLRGQSGDAPANGANGAPTPPAATGSERPQVGLLRRVMLREDPTVPVLGSAIRLARQRCASMRMFVARPRRASG